MIDPRFEEPLRALVDSLPSGTPDRDLYERILRQVVALHRRGLDRGELKLLSGALKDFARACEVFGRHRDRRKVAIFGSARTPPGSPIYEHCRRFARAIVERGYMVITGAGPGIMQAGNEGAGRDDSFGVSINLPFEASANPFIDGDPKLVHFKYFFTRKLAFVKESAAIVLFPGGFGTHDEGYESLTLLQTGKSDPVPVILMDLPGGDYWPSWERYQRENLLARGLISPSDRNLYRYTTDIDKAVEEIERFYRVYHSIRYVGEWTVLRLKRAPTPELMARLNERFRDLLAAGDFEVGDAHPEESDESEAVRSLPRIQFRFSRRHLGRLRRLIDEINLSVPDAPAVGAARDPHAGTGSWKLSEVIDGEDLPPE
ncbi:MAG: LOG family protein [Planctomycetota bacterium]|nr:MAG: LOG family protein [Planctomycetota bacterium]